MKPIRIFVEKKEAFATEAINLRAELNAALGLDLGSVRIVNIYDLFGFTEKMAEECAHKIFADPVTDILYAEAPQGSSPFIAYEPLPGMFDSRASAAEECVRLLFPGDDITVRSGRLLIFDSDTSDEDISRIYKYCVNSVECREKDLSEISHDMPLLPEPEKVIDGFIGFNSADAADFLRSYGLAMSEADLMEAVAYFRSEDRNPTLTELKILDAYWSDHCRHTTFLTSLSEVKIEPSPAAEAIADALTLWHDMRRELGRDSRPLTLMDLATIAAARLRIDGRLDNLDISEENNAAGIFVDVEVDGEPERWLIQLKNETHNHPTEIEPFGGAATCLGGVVRDPLSNRAFVYQALRVSGTAEKGDSSLSPLPGKLPQRVISTLAAKGFSSYGNQLGIPTGLVREIYHPGYVAKHLEAGVAVGAVRAEHIRRETPTAGDIILLVGGATGRDGVGGASGSSKSHTSTSLYECGSEVQKGNPLEERKLLRLFRNPDILALIKKANDFGAGGISVAVGELADGVDIFLDRIKTKYSGLSATELALSESQERMAVVVSPSDVNLFISLCHAENAEATPVARVTDTGRLRMFSHSRCVADLSREFLESAGASRQAVANISFSPVPDFTIHTEGPALRDRIISVISDPNVISRRGLVEMFDSSIGASTVLMPYGGKTQLTESQVAVQLLPTSSDSSSLATLLSYGFNPFLTEQSPFHGGAMAVAESVAKAVAAGASLVDIRLSFQEFFEKLQSEESWGKPLAALLGALKMQMGLGVAAIGGKDSMSGTFHEINVPPTLISYAFAPVDAGIVVSSEFKAPGHNLYLLNPPKDESGLPDFGWLHRAYADYHSRVLGGEVLSAYAPGFGSIIEAVCKMAFGNLIGASLSLDESMLFSRLYGAILLESATELPSEFYTRIGTTVQNPYIHFNGESFSLDFLLKANTEGFASVYPLSPVKTDRTVVKNADLIGTSHPSPAVWRHEPVSHPRVLIPVFPGTNCDYDMAAAFEREGAQVEFSIFSNLDFEAIRSSVEELKVKIDKCHILALSGGFSAGDEPDGSGKYMAGVLRRPAVKKAIEGLLSRGGLILGICNGFQALLKTGLLPSGHFRELSEASPSLVRNDINRHVSRMVTLRVTSTASPWLSGFEPGQLFTVASSHGEGKFMASPALAASLAAEGRIAFQYADPFTGDATMQFPYNPNGSVGAIEGIISPCGKILGKMAHSERYRHGIMKNIQGDKNGNIFRNAVRYFRGE